MDATTTPNNLPSTAAANLFKDAERDHEAQEAALEHERRVDLLITPKGHQRLRAFGYEVVKVADSLPASTSDRRSL